MSKRTKAWPLALKLEAVKARRQGMSCREVSRITGMSVSAVSRCLRLYAKHGEAGLRVGGGDRCEEKRWRQTPKTSAAGEAVKHLGPLPEGTGVGRVQGLLYRLGFLKVSKGTVGRVLEEQGRKPKKPARRRRNRPVKVRHFERARPNELWQTDITTFMLRGQYRVYLIAFMDDNSRFLVGWGLFRRQTASNVMEVFRAAIEKRGLPKEVLSDNGRQYYTWRGKSQFTVMLTKLGIAHIRSRPYHPQTLGKIESFWRNLWQECLSQMPLSSFEEAESKIGEYVEHYNYKRPHQGIGNMMPSDRYFQVASQVEKLVEEHTAKVESSGPTLGEYKAPTYLIGNIGGKELRMVAKDAEVSLRDAPRQEVESQDAPVVEGPAALVEASDERSVETEAFEPAGAPGADPAVPEGGCVGQAALQGGGGVEGTALPVAEGVQGCGTEGVGTEAIGSEAREGGGGADGGIEAAGACGAAGEAAQGDPQGEGALEAEGGGGPSDHHAQCVGPADGGGV